jgi:hypothetical protein
MSSPATSAPRTIWHGLGYHFHLSRKGIVFLIALACLICFAVVFYVKLWPFSRQAVLQDLKEATDSEVTAQSYHPTFFPPGCVLYGLEFYHGPHHFKMIEIQKLRVRGGYLAMLRRHVPRIVAEGAHVFIPAFGSNETFSTQHSSTVVDELIANGSFVEFEPKDAHKEPFRFDVHEARFTGLRWASPLSYHLKFHNPNPPGEISADGKFGPWAKDHPEQTAFSGDYTFQHADLGVYGGIRGILSSKGKFNGQLKEIKVSGTTDTPDFQVKSSGNKFDVSTNFEASVNGENGDTFLKNIEVHFAGTTLLAHGSVARTEGQKGKFTRIQISSERGRIQDILGLFTADRAPMSGQAGLQLTAELPATTEPFLRRVKVEGRFSIASGTFSKTKTQRGVDELSAGARGENKDDPEMVMTDLKGKVALIEQVAHFSDVSFTIPGAHAQMHGTYSVSEPYRINLHGQMRVATRISKTTTGMKSFLLKVMDPIFKKKKKGEIVPVHIQGTYEKPDFGLDLGSKQNEKK